MSVGGEKKLTKEMIMATAMAIAIVIPMGFPILATFFLIRWLKKKNERNNRQHI